MAFEVSLGLGGWLVVALALGAFPLRHVVPSPWMGVVLFLTVAAGARVFAFPLSGLVRGLPPSKLLSLDAAVIVAGALSVGAPPIAAGIALLLGLDIAIRAALTPRSTLDGKRAIAIAREALFAGGAAGGLLVATAAFFGGRMHAAHEHLWLVPAFGLCFLVAHAVMRVVHASLFNQPIAEATRHAFLSLLAEVTLLPLGAVMLVIWAGRRPLAVALLGLTYLLVNFGFFRIAHITAALRRRVRELQTLTRVSQAMAAELELPRMTAGLLRELQRALPLTGRLELRLRRAGLIDCHALERGRLRLRSSTVPVAACDRYDAMVLEELVEMPEDATRSRLIAPLKMYGEVLGCLVLESHKVGAYGAHEEQLVAAVVSQAASALENARLNTLANFDGLTGLYCRRYFDTRLVEEVERGRRFETTFCVLLLDVDNFKRLNDTRGHLAGDRALREVARLSQAQLRNVDLAARYGGEELVFLLPRTSITDAQVVAERIRDAVGSHAFPDVGRITVSIGVAAFADTSEDVQQIANSVLARADLALYRAKSLGKDRVELDLGPIELSPSLAPINRRRRA